MPQDVTYARREVSIGGASCAYWEYSAPAEIPDRSNRTVVLIHGFRGDHHGLELIATAVKSSRIIVPDLPGFGLSQRLVDEDGFVPHTLDNLGLWLKYFCASVAEGPFVIVGHSFGTLVVANSLSQGCNPIDVVLINPISSPALSGPRGVLSQLALLYYRVAGALPNRLGHALLSNRIIVRVMSEVMAKTEDMHMRAWIHDQHDAHFSTFTDRESLIESFRASISHTVHEYVSALPPQTTIIAADRDDITPLAAQLSLAHRVHESRLVIVPAVGHLVHYEAAGVVAEVINEALPRETLKTRTHGK